MSAETGFQDTIRGSSADLSADTNIGRVIALGATGLGGLAGAAGADAYGILVDGGRRSGDPIKVITNGPARGRAGGAINEGDRLTSDANGQLVVVSAAADIICGIAKQDAADGDRFDILAGPWAQTHDANP